MDHDPGDPRVDDLRQQLRSLGYLDAGVDRFVLGAANERRRPAAIAGLVSLRIGALAALLIGPAAALGIAGGVPGLITGPRDGFVVALYVGALFGVGVAIAALSAVAVVSWLAGRGERLRRPSALAAGLAVTLASLAYLTLWWDASTLAAHSGSFGSAWTVLALALAAAVSVLIGHAVTVAALAVSVATVTSTTPRHGVPGASWRMMTAIGALTFSGALLLFHLTSRYEAAPDTPPLTVVSSGIKLRLIAIDGFDPALAARLAAGGRLPALDAALGLSAIADTRPAATIAGRSVGDTPGEAHARATVEFEDTRDPARLWTTIATGRAADAHAVRGLETRRVLGLQGTLASGQPSPLARALAAVTDTVRLTRPSVVSRVERRVKTLWEVAASTGLKTAVINWWATWPAPPQGGGIVLSDRATLRLEHGGELDAEIAPPDLYDSLRIRWPALRQQAADLASPLNGPVLRRSAELDALQLALARDVTEATTDLVCTYFPGLDLVQHALLSGTDRSASSPSAMAARLTTLEEYYVFLDRLLAPALGANAGELVLVMTSPGRVQAATSGLLTLRGIGANARARDAAARPVDIAPTVLHALGVPISKELPGRALIELFSADFARRYPLRQVETYGVPTLQRAPRGARPLDQEMIERLRSLGYLQ